MSDLDAYDAICNRGNLTRRQLLTWAGDRRAPGLPVFVEGCLLHIRGSVDPRVFQRAFQAVLAECDALRMVVDDVEGWPRQRLLASVEATAEMIDVSSARVPSAALATLAQERLATAVSSGGPLLDAVLVRLRPQHHVWVLLQHQLVSDAWSFRLVHQRLVHHYEREQRGQRAVDAAAPPQFQEYLTYERHYRASPQYRMARAYWESRVPHALGQPSAQRASFAGDATKVSRVSHRLGRATTAALRRLAATQSASPDVGLFSIVASLMIAHTYRTTGTPDVVLSVPFANRPSQRFKNTVGSFMNVCPIRVGVERGDTFLTLLGRVEREAWEAARHQGCAVSHAPGAQPYDVLVNVHKEAVAARAFAGVPMDIEALAPTHRFGALLVGVHDFNAAGDLVLALDFNEATFGPATREDMSRALLRLVDGCLAEPARPLESVGVVPATRREAAPRERGEAPAVESSVPPSTAVARAVAAIWCELLGRSSVGLHDDFFALGGDSLLAYRLLVRVDAELLAEVSADAFFARPTVAGVAAAVATAHADAVSRGDIEAALQEIEALSDDEVAGLGREDVRGGECGARPNDG